MRNTGEPLQGDLTTALYQFPRIRLSFIPQRIALGCVNHSLAKIVEARCFQRILEPTDGFDLVSSSVRLVGETLPFQIIKPLQSGPIECRRLCHLDHGGERRVFRLAVLRDVVDDWCSHSHQFQRNGCISGQMRENQCDVAACGYPTQGDARRIDVEVLGSSRVDVL